MYDASLMIYHYDFSAVAAPDASRVLSRLQELYDALKLTAAKHEALAAMRGIYAGCSSSLPLVFHSHCRFASPYCMY